MRVIISTKGLTLIAILFHLIGLIGIGVFHVDMISRATPIHLLLMFLLLAISFADTWKAYYLWMPVALIVGFGVEWVGVHKGWLFGSYSYTNVLGWKWQDIPVLISCNWVIIVCGAIALSSLLTENKYLNSIVAATVATAADWVLEPVALKLNYWHWSGGHIPQLNYICWWCVSFVLALLWHLFKNQYNQFAVNLFIIQIIFFAFLQII